MTINKMLLPLSCFLVILVSQSGAWPHPARSHGGPHRPHDDSREQALMPAHLCRIDGPGDFDVDTLFDIGCPTECDTEEQEVTWEDVTVTGVYYTRPCRVRAGPVFSVCKIVSQDESSVYLDLGCSDIDDCELVREEEEVTWEELPAIAYRCSRSGSHDSEEEAGETRSGGDGREPRGRRRGHRDHHNRRHTPRLCKVEDDSGYVYLDLNCPEDCNSESVAITWDNNDATASYCGRHDRSRE